MLEDDIRHSDRNGEARRRAADQLTPAMREALCIILEIRAEELGDYRDMLKDIRAERKAREERKKEGFKEAVKWTVTATLGGLLTYVATHLQGGGK